MSDTDIWIFGYGSLMWKPGFDYLERRTARLDGYGRSFALWSVRYRGTEEDPGLVVGLDWRPAGSCTGIAFRVCRTKADEVRDYLAERELVTRSYFEICTPVVLLAEESRGESSVDAICYVLDRSHDQYARGISRETQADRILKAVGPMGPNLEYFEKTVAHLDALGIEDPELVELAGLVRAGIEGRD